MAILKFNTQEIAELYTSGLTMDQVAAKTGATKRSVANHLIRAGIKSRGYSERFGTAWRGRALGKMAHWSKELAYIMGYTLADGSIDMLNPRSPGMSFQCVARDQQILQFIKDFLELDADIQPSKEGSQSRLRFYGSDVVNRFMELGMMVRKTWEDYPFPDVPEQFRPDFIRGQFDGNGCVSKFSHKKGGVVHFLGSRSIITSIRDHLCNDIGVSRRPIMEKPGHYAVVWGSRFDICKIMEYLYPEDAVSFLLRKKVKFEQILNSYGTL